MQEDWPKPFDSHDNDSRIHPRHQENLAHLESGETEARDTDCDSERVLGCPAEDLYSREAI